MILKFIQTIITYNPHNDILDIELTKKQMNDVFRYNSLSTYFKEIKKSKINDIFCILLLESFHNVTPNLNTFLLLNNKKDIYKRGQLLLIYLILLTPY